MNHDDAQVLQEAKRMLRYLWQQGFVIHLDALDHDALFELMGKLDAMAARHSGEPQLSNVGQTVGRPAITAEAAHARQMESVCSSCGGSAINGICRRCE